MPLKISEIILLLLLIRADHLYTSDYILACSYKRDPNSISIEAQFSVRDIDFTLCTHYIYWSAYIDNDRITIKAADSDVEEGQAGKYKHFNDGKKNNPKAKTILSLGGIGFVSDMAFRTLYGKDNNFKTFAKHAVGFLRDKGFDGLNIDWQTINEPTIRVAFPKLMQALRTAFDNDYADSKLLLTMTGFALPSVSNTYYDLAEIRKNVDYVFMPMSQLAPPNTASFLDPLYTNSATGKPYRVLSVNDSIYEFARLGMPYSKMVMGVTALGNYVELIDPSRYEPYSLIWPTLPRGPKYNILGRLAYPEICDMMNTSVRYFDYVQKNPYLVSGRFWVGYTDTESLKAKIEYMKLYGLGGLEFSHFNEDDFSGKACGSGKFPLLSFIQSEMYGLQKSVANTTVGSDQAALTVLDTTTHGRRILIAESRDVLYLLLLASGLAIFFMLIPCFVFLMPTRKRRRRLTKWVSMSEDDDGHRGSGVGQGSTKMFSKEAQED